MAPRSKSKRAVKKAPTKPATPRKQPEIADPDDLSSAIVGGEDELPQPRAGQRNRYYRLFAAIREQVDAGVYVKVGVYSSRSGARQVANRLESQRDKLPEGNFLMETRVIDDDSSALYVAWQE